MDEIQINSIKSPLAFMDEIETLVKSHRIDYMEAVLLYCEQTGLEVESAGEMIRQHPKLKARIQDEAETLNYFPKSAKLPI